MEDASTNTEYTIEDTTGRLKVSARYHHMSSCCDYIDWTGLCFVMPGHDWKGRAR